MNSERVITIAPINSERVSERVSDSFAFWSPHEYLFLRFANLQVKNDTSYPCCGH